MAYLGSWAIDNLLTFPANTHAADTGAATDADAVPSYRVYEDETGTAILTGNMAKLDDANTTGFYSEQLTLSAANGFEKGKCYTVYIAATVDSVVGTMAHTFQIEAEVDANVVSGSVTVATNNDKTGYELADGAITAAKIAAGALDAVWSVATRTLTAFGFGVTADTVSDKTGYSLAVAPPTAAEVRTEMDSNSTKLANLDATVSSRATPADLPAAPDNAGIAAIKAVTDAIPDSGALTDIASILADTAELQGDWVNGGRLDLLLDAIKVVTDALTSAAATKLALSAGTIVVASAVTGTLSTTAMTTDLTEATSDHYNGRIVIFTSGVLTGQATDITDYDGATKTITMTALTEAPSNGDDFVIV